MPTLLDDVLKNEVYPAFGCTDPITCAYAAAIAAAELKKTGESVTRFDLLVDPGTLKNGNSVAVPNAGGARGNVIAAAMGAVVARPELKLEILATSDSNALSAARKVVDSGDCNYRCLIDSKSLCVDITVYGTQHSARCVLAGGHTAIARVELDDRPCDGYDIAKVDIDPDAAEPIINEEPQYRKELAVCDIPSILELAEQLTDEQRAYLRRGIEMNLAMAARGFEITATAYQLQYLRRQGFTGDDLFYRGKLQIAAGIDARMAGIEQSVMTSGGSGNQGMVAIVTPYLVGRELELDEERILRGVAASHLMNAYVKCFVGENSSICGCAVSAAIGAATAIVFMKCGADRKRIDMAIGNVIGDLSGLICDGAKPGCAMKGVSAVDTAIRSGLMALGDYGLTSDQGLTGESAEASIRNLARIARDGMFRVDPTMIHILEEKALAAK